jgi:hypothetical protein
MENEISNINTEKILEELKCPICLEIFDDPIIELPNQHIFCNKCLNNTNNNKKCPICKEEIKEIIKPRIIINILNSIEIKCSEVYIDKKCDFKGNVASYYTHLKNCEILILNVKEKLKNVCEDMKKIIDIEINPHLIKEHFEIYNKYVQDWKWLEYLKKDWKWWWWANKPWWENKACPECNELWHKYENEVQFFENKRISFLSSCPLLQKNFTTN